MLGKRPTMVVQMLYTIRCDRLIDPGDDAMNPEGGTAMTNIVGKKWVTSERDMQRQLLVSSFTIIEGPGASIHIA